MINQSLQKLWLKIEKHLNNAFNLLPPNPIDNQEGGRVQNFHEFLNANELELALDELEGLSEVNKVPNEFWNDLFEAASLMKLEEHKKRYVINLK